MAMIMVTVIDTHTEPQGTCVTAVEIKDITLPDNMQRAMAKEAEAEFLAATKLGEDADVIAAHPVALQLRTLQTMAQIATEKNSTIIFPTQSPQQVLAAMDQCREFA